MTLLNNQRMADSVSGMYQDLEELLMRNIIRHIKDYGKPIDSDDWQLQKLAEIGKLNKENIRIIAQQAGVSQTAVEDLLNIAAQEAIEQLEPGLQNLARDGLLHSAETSAKKSENIKRTVDTLQKQARETLNLCNTNMLYKAKDVYKKLVTNICFTAKEIEQKQEFIDILNKSASNVVVGAESRTKAVRECIKQFNKKGIPAFVDKAGREWTPEAYVNMCVRNTSRNVADEVQFERCKEYGCNLIEISSHSGARPKCAKDQGKIFNLDNESGVTTDAEGTEIRFYPWDSSSYGDPDGILGINCGHHKHAFIPGVNIQTYFPVDETENDKLYEQTQVQRALERDVRKQKRECMLYDELGDAEAFEQSAVKLKAKETKLKNYVDSNNKLHRRKDREQVIGFDKTISAKAVSANKKNALKITKKSVAKSSESGIMKSGSDNVALENQRYGRNKSALVNKTYIDSGEYKRKYDHATDNQAVNKTLYDCAKKALKHRSGTVLEDMYWIDGKTGKLLCSVTDSTDERTIKYSDRIKKAVKTNNNIVTIHTHPSSMPPSVDDFNSCFNNGYKNCFVACHDGKVYRYLANEKVNSRLYSLYIQSYINEGLSEFDAQLKTIDKLSKSYKIKLWEVSCDG